MGRFRDQAGVVHLDRAIGALLGAASQPMHQSRMRISLLSPRWIEFTGQPIMQTGSRQERQVAGTK